MTAGLLRPIAYAAAFGVSAACSSADVSPASLDVRTDTCSRCRMAVSDQRFAAQIVSPGEEPRFFDDIGCLRAYLEARPRLEDRSAVFVASYASQAWVPARTAVYVRHESIQTPMGSHYVAFGTGPERDGSPDARGGMKLSAAELFAGYLPGGPR